MSTSGTVAQTHIDVATLIDTAFRRAGKLPSTVSGELLEAARNALYYLISDLANRGINLFCIRKNILNVRANTPGYPQGLGTDDILNVLYRTLNEPLHFEFVEVDAIGWEFDSPLVVENVSGYFTTGGQTALVIEYLNTITMEWQALEFFSLVDIEDGADFATDLQSPVVAQKWRVRDTSGNNVLPTSVAFRTVNTEVNMSQMNRDDYVNLPNKQSSNWYGSQVGDQRGLQFWYDKQINPVLYIWPVSNRVQDQIIVYFHGQIEDPGDLTNELAVPARWYEAVIFTLAARIGLELPPGELPPGRLELLTGMAEEATNRAGQGESDGSSYRMLPRIGGYTK